MNTLKKGDLLWGTKRGKKEARHPLVFIEGPDAAPNAVVLTHSPTSRKYPCNIKLPNIYDKNGEVTYFISHRIAKIAEWGPYIKSGRLRKEDMDLIEEHIPSTESMTWHEYKEYKKNGCPDHKTA